MLTINVLQQLDRQGRLSLEGWESSQSAQVFPVPRLFHPSHRYRRKRWLRKRSGSPKDWLVGGIHAFYQPIREASPTQKEKEAKQVSARIAVQVYGGQWALSSSIPLHGAVYGAIRARSSRWPETLMSENRPINKVDPSAAIYELCYAITPLDGAWGELSRLMIVSSRFLLHNNSKVFSFEMKQAGVPDSCSIIVEPGKMAPFHWTDCRRPELVCVRPAGRGDSPSIYNWSGGFDPLTIGAVPLRIKKQHSYHSASDSKPFTVCSIKMEADVRKKTGGTGINLSFEEENPSGDGALFRIENRSAFPV